MILQARVVKLNKYYISQDCGIYTNFVQYVIHPVYEYYCHGIGLVIIISYIIIWSITLLYYLRQFASQQEKFSLAIQQDSFQFFTNSSGLECY